MSAAQEEFDLLISKNTGPATEDRVHPEDRAPLPCELQEHNDYDDGDDLDEEERHRTAQLNAAMRAPAPGSAGWAGGGGLKLPPASFDSGRATGVKGVIADARSYQMARQTKWSGSTRHVRCSNSEPRPPVGRHVGEGQNSDTDADEEVFLQQWRLSRRRELENEARGNVVRSRRTSPSLRRFGRLDEVDAMGYLDAIERVGRESVVVVFVYDAECQVSAAIEEALRPLVAAHPTVNFVRIHYDDIEFDNAAVPAILAYRNQGELFANLTGIVEMIPDNEDFDSDSLKKLFIDHGIL